MAKLKYKGGGFLVGVPSRDLSAEEVKRYGTDWLILSGLYEEYPKPVQRVKYIEPEPVETGEGQED